MTKTIPNTIFKFSLLFLSLAAAGCGLTLPSKISVHSERLFFVSTADGWRLALHRYRPRGLDKSRNPVLLVTGPNYNASYWEIHDKAHFARYLAKRGWDVWALSLRGTGRSTRPGFTTLDTLENLELAEKWAGGFEFKSFDWTLDDYVTQDLPTAIEFIQQKTRNKKVSLIGAGFGGSILLAYLGTDQKYDVDRAVVVAPPFKYFGPVNDVFTRAFANHGQKNGASYSLTGILFFNLANMDPEVESACATHAMESIPPGVLRQIRDLIYEGELRSADKKRNYFDSLGRIRRPMLLLCGKKDNLAPPEGVLEIYQRISSKNKKFHEFGQANLHKVDYGHDDLILGKGSKREVYPYIEEWLRENEK